MECSVVFFFLVKGRKYPEYEQLMEDMFSRLHIEKVGKGQRNDLVDPFDVYDDIIDEYYTKEEYTSFDAFLQESFRPFCIGYLNTSHDKISEQGFPIAWGAKRYEYYIIKGAECIQQEQLRFPDMSTLHYTTFDSTHIDRDTALSEGYNQYSHIISSAKDILSPQTYEFFFGHEKIQYHGVEMIFRLVLSQPWDASSPVIGELYKMLYNDIFPVLKSPLSLRFLSRS